MRLRGVLLACLVLSAAACRSASSDRLVIRAGRLLDPVAGRYVENAVIYIEGGRIARVTSGRAPTRSGDRVIEVPTLLPGLIDAHTHLAWAGAAGVGDARATLAAGFTTVRNLGSNGDEDLKLRTESGVPRLLLSGPGLGAKDGVCHQTFGDGAVVTSAQHAREKVRAQIRERRVDVIKVCAGGGVVASTKDAEAIELDVETLTAIVDEAHEHGVKVAAHAQGAVAIRKAVSAGVDSIEHGGGIDRETALLLRERKVVLVPTLARLAARIEAAKAQGSATDAVERMEANRQRIMANVRAAVAAGVTIVNGSDASVLPHGRNAEELQALVSVGLTPLEAIRSATTHAAALLGRSDIGCVSAGCSADFVSIEGDPLTDVSALLRPGMVIARGRIMKGP